MRYVMYICAYILNYFYPNQTNNIPSAYLCSFIYVPILLIINYFNFIYLSIKLLYYHISFYE